MRLNCDLFSLGKIVKLEDDGEKNEDNDINKLLSKPNPFQTDRQIRWDYMFRLMTGNAYFYSNSKVSNENTMLYLLDNSKMDFPFSMIDKADMLFDSKKGADDFKNQIITYRYHNGKTKKIKYSDIIHFTDLTSSAESWFKGKSTIDALYKVLSNSELSLDAKNTNLLFSGKYMVGGSVKEGDLNNFMLGQDEKDDIQRKTMEQNPVTAVKSMIDIKRFVEDFGKQGFDDAFSRDLFNIGRVYSMPKDIIEALAKEGAKYNDKELAMGQYVDYVMQPKGDDFIEGIKQYFGFEGNYTMDWSHLPFNVFAKERKEESEKRKAESLNILLRSGVDAEDAQKQLGYEFENDIDYQRVGEPTQRSGDNTGQKRNPEGNKRKETE